MSYLNTNTNANNFISHRILKQNNISWKPVFDINKYNPNYFVVSLLSVVTKPVSDKHPFPTWKCHIYAFCAAIGAQYFI